MGQNQQHEEEIEEEEVTEEENHWKENVDAVIVAFFAFIGFFNTLIFLSHHEYAPPQKDYPACADSPSGMVCDVSVVLKSNDPVSLYTRSLPPLPVRVWRITSMLALKAYHYAL